MLCVANEYDGLRKAVVHRPGGELDRLTIDNKDEFLFDDILWLQEAQAEFDSFISILRQEKVEVFFFEDLFCEVLRSEQYRREILADTLALEALDERLSTYLLGYCSELEPCELARVLLSGLTKGDIAPGAHHLRSICFRMMDSREFVIRPLPNTYFQRDPYTLVNSSAIMSAMHFEIRKREALYCKYVLSRHPLFEGISLLWGGEPGETCSYNVEGGDILVLDQNTVAMGMGERTNAGTVQILGSRLAEYAGVRTVLAVDIPKARFTTHLDTVFTMVDRDTFVMYPGLQHATRAFELTYGEKGELLKIVEHQGLVEGLRRVLGLEEVHVVETGGGDPVIAAREQWNDATNCLALASRKVVSYNRNTRSNEALRDKGIRVLQISGKELDRGRGGPRCMVNPLKRSQ